MEEQLILSLTLQNPQTDEEKFKNSCKIYDQCHIQCDDENLNRVLNVPNFEKNEVASRMQYKRSLSVQNRK